MSKKKVKKYDGKFKVKVMIEALKGDKTLSQIGSEYKIFPKYITKWKQHLIEQAPRLFESEKESREIEKRFVEQQSVIDELYRQNGKTAAQLEWLKKKCRENGFGCETPLY
jgi:transposase-like protein